MNAATAGPGGDQAEGPELQQWDARDPGSTEAWNR
jgi:hypothetical protein